MAALKDRLQEMEEREAGYRIELREVRAVLESFEEENAVLHTQLADQAASLTALRHERDEWKRAYEGTEHAKLAAEWQEERAIVAASLTALKEQAERSHERANQEIANRERSQIYASQCEAATARMALKLSEAEAEVTALRDQLAELDRTSDELAAICIQHEQRAAEMTAEQARLKEQRDNALSELTDTRRFWQAAKAELEALEAERSALGPLIAEWYWAKLTVDNERPDFTREQMKRLVAAEEALMEVAKPFGDTLRRSRVPPQETKENP
jgi:chromosome segregation ATPase